MNRIKIIDNQLMIREGFFKKSVFHLDSLRLIYIFLPESLKSWFLVSSSAGIESYNLDSVSDENIQSLTQTFDEMVRQEKAYKLSGIKLCLADYQDRSVIVPLKYFKHSQVNIFDYFLKYREQRMEKRREWLGSAPRVTLKGLFGQRAIVDARGFHRGKKSIAWKDVGQLQINTVNMSTDLLVIPQGIGTGFFSLKKYHYSLRISLKKKDLFLAECNFWMSSGEEVKENQSEPLSRPGASQLKEHPLFPVQ